MDRSWTEIAEGSNAKHVGIRWQERAAEVGSVMAHRSIHPADWLESDCGIEDAEDVRLSGVCAFAADLTPDGMRLDLSGAIAEAARLARLCSASTGYLVLLACDRLGEDLPESDSGGIVMVAPRVLACAEAHEFEAK